jgi:hypothetical protein
MRINDDARRRAPNQPIETQTKESAMHALKDLFTSDVGLMSISGIVFMLGMGVFYVRYFLKHMKEDEQRAAAKKR